MTINKQEHLRDAFAGLKMKLVDFVSVVVRAVEDILARAVANLDACVICFKFLIFSFVIFSFVTFSRRNFTRGSSKQCEYSL